MNGELFKPLSNLAAYEDREILEDIHRMLVELTRSKAEATHKATPKVSGTPQRRHEYAPEFETLWKEYPARNGSNSKWKAQQCWRARRREAMASHGTTGARCVEEMLAGVKRYRAWCEATGKVGTDYVMQASRFLGPSREFEQAWQPPAPETKVIKIPANGDDLVTFAKDYGITTAPGESWFEFRKRVEAAVEASL